MLSVIMLRVIMLRVIILRVIMLSVIMLRVIMLSVLMLGVDSKTFYKCKFSVPALKLPSIPGPSAIKICRVTL
jgi:hypothetical protein